MLIDITSLKTPQGCVNPALVTEFLRASRKVSDDNVRNRLGQTNCAKVITEVYDEWYRRDSVFDFCKKVSNTFEEAQNTSGSTENRPISWLVDHARDHIEFTKTPTDPRVDAYASRDESGNSVTMSSFDWIKTEELAESIIRDSTVESIKNRCGLSLPAYNPSPK